MTFLVFFMKQMSVNIYLLHYRENVQQKRKFDLSSVKNGDKNNFLTNLTKVRLSFALHIIFIFISFKEMEFYIRTNSQHCISYPILVLVNKSFPWFHSNKFKFSKYVVWMYFIGWMILLRAWWSALTNMNCSNFRKNSRICVPRSGWNFFETLEAWCSNVKSAKMISMSWRFRVTDWFFALETLLKKRFFIHLMEEFIFASSHYSLDLRVLLGFSALSRSQNYGYRHFHRTIVSRIIIMSEAIYFHTWNLVGR